ncbi:MAG: tRNA (adenosine(37)-N6)-threonylcarbamoyltransferase complex ATPase subunit type 1 TsaE [Rhodospirillales bacterium]
MPDPLHIIADVMLADEAATRSRAALLAGHLAKGDVIALQGTLGMGKTSFARALINALPGPEEEVPSPTFTLVQTYDRGGLEIWHFDLYRLKHPEDAHELGIEDAFFDAVSLIEWPEKLGPLLPDARLLVTLSDIDQAEGRRLTISGNSRWAERLDDLFKDSRTDG